MPSNPARTTTRSCPACTRWSTSTPSLLIRTWPSTPTSPFCSDRTGPGGPAYARILKRISAVRTPEDILPNAHAPATTATTPSARIEYRLSGQAYTVHWKNEPGLAPFTRISVFDSAAVSLHVDSDLGYVYPPAELALFSHVATGIRGIQQLISAEVAELKSGANPLLARFARGTTLYPMIATLGATSDLAELARPATVGGDAEEQRDRLQAEDEALRGHHPRRAADQGATEPA